MKWAAEANKTITLTESFCGTALGEGRWPGGRQFKCEPWAIGAGKVNVSLQSHPDFFERGTTLVWNDKLLNWSSNRDWTCPRWATKRSNTEKCSLQFWWFSSRTIKTHIGKSKSGDWQTFMKHLKALKGNYLHKYIHGLYRSILKLLLGQQMDLSIEYISKSEAKKLAEAAPTEDDFRCLFHLVFEHDSCAHTCTFKSILGGKHFQFWPKPNITQE